MLDAGHKGYAKVPIILPKKREIKIFMLASFWHIKLYMISGSGEYKVQCLINLSCLQPSVVYLLLEKQINEVPSLDTIIST